MSLEGHVRRKFGVSLFSLARSRKLNEYEIRAEYIADIYYIHIDLGNSRIKDHQRLQYLYALHPRLLTIFVLGFVNTKNLQGFSIL
jgi:hypothetical protein